MCRVGFWRGNSVFLTFAGGLRICSYSNARLEFCKTARITLMVSRQRARYRNKKPGLEQSAPPPVGSVPDDLSVFSGSHRYRLAPPPDAAHPTARWRPVLHTRARLTHRQARANEAVLTGRGSVNLKRRLAPFLAVIRPTGRLTRVNCLHMSRGSARDESLTAINNELALLFIRSLSF